MIEAAELWDPATQTFSPAGSLTQARVADSAASLPDGRVLIIGSSSRWQQHDTPTGFPGQWNLVVGPYDTLWTRTEFEPVGEWSSLPRAMSHYDGAEWQRWGEDHFPMHDDGNLLWALQPMDVGPDGSLWSQVRWGSWVSPFSPEWTEPECDGADRFDGETASRFLEGLCVRALDAATDGSVWILAGPDEATWDLYVVTPEAGAAAE